MGGGGGVYECFHGGTAWAVGVGAILDIWTGYGVSREFEPNRLFVLVV